MEESVTYQAIFHKGFEIGLRKGARKFLLLQGTERFGEASAAVRKELESIDNLMSLEQMEVHLFSVNSWQELLESATPKNGKKS
jgi:hypothetical protein